MLAGDDIFATVEKAFNFRGDVTIRTRQGQVLEGYVFDRHAPSADPANCFLRLLPRTGDRKITLGYADIAQLEFTGQDAAAGKSYQNWLKRRASRD